MLELAGVSRRFGGLDAVAGLDLKLEAGEVVGLIGPNGSGKSTTINLISGWLPLSSGRIVLDGRSIGELPLHRRVACGLARTFQGVRLFGQLSVAQNIRVAQEVVPNWHGAPAADGITQALEFAGLAGYGQQLAGSLTAEQQRRLELARALATRPRVLMLDEPAAGMTLAELDQLRRRIVRLRQAGVAILLVEHVMELVMAVADRIVVLDFGRKIADAAPAQVRADPAVRRAYLGGAAA
jgi:branched-chain amino acid transport system ATP-binding protein